MNSKYKKKVNQLYQLNFLSNPIDQYWLTSQLSGAGESLFLYALSIGGLNFSQNLQFFSLLFLILFILNFKNKNWKFSNEKKYYVSLCILIMPVFLFLVSTSKPQVFSLVTNFLALILSIIYLLIEFKNIPWIGLTVAITFSFYTLIRKKINISSDIGLFFETLLISPIALILFSSLVLNNTNVFGFNNPTLSFYLFFAGFMTLVPLFMYIKGFELIGIGPASMIFFLTPTAQFFLSIFYLGQPLEIEKLISFLFIWIAVIIYLNELRKE